MPQHNKHPVTGKPLSIGKANANTSKSFGSYAKNILSVILIGGALTVIASYLVTETFTWGYKVPNVYKYWRKLTMTEIVLTPEELALYNGTDPTKPIYLAVIGDVFDVTAGKDYYGPEGGYKFFAGRDAGRAFATGCFESHLTSDLRGLTDDQIKSIEDWRSFYHDHDKYLYVGKVVHPPVDPNSPIPEDCNIEGGKKE